jgi:nucleoside-diphosphate-sugar epimerase
MVRKRRFPIVGNGAGVWSFVHIDDAAGATRAAIERMWHALAGAAATAKSFNVNFAAL